MLFLTILLFQPNDETLAVGMVDGMISVQRRELEGIDEDEVTMSKQRKKRGSYRYYSDKYIPDTRNVDLVIKQNTKQSSARYDSCLRKFQYSKSLDTVLTTYTTNRMPHVTVSLLQELIRQVIISFFFFTHIMNFFIRFTYWVTPQPLTATVVSSELPKKSKM